MNDATDFTEIVGQFSQQNLSIATAESLTAGMLSSAIADVPGASAVFHGGIVAYNNNTKHRLLGVSVDTLASRGAVDSETAKQMAQGARQQFQTDIGVSTTGVAGPEPSEGKAVGLTFIALASKEHTTVKLLRFDGNRDHNRRATVAACVQLMAEWLAEQK